MKLSDEVRNAPSDATAFYLGKEDLADRITALEADKEKAWENSRFWMGKKEEKERECAVLRADKERLELELTEAQEQIEGHKQWQREYMDQWADCRRDLAERARDNPLFHGGTVSSTDVMIFRKACTPEAILGLYERIDNARDAQREEDALIAEGKLCVICDFRQKAIADAIRDK